MEKKRTWHACCYQWLCQNLTVNGYYFGFLLLALIGLNCLQFSTLEQGKDGASYLFFLYALAQSAFEVMGLLFIGSLIHAFFPRIFFYTFISGCFFFFVLHCIDFLLIRFMDMSIYYAIDLAIHETWENFVELIRLSEITLQKWIFFIVFCAFLLPVLAMGLYWLLEKAHKKCPLGLTHKHVLSMIVALPVTLVALDLLGTSRLTYHDYRYYCRILPWKSTLVAQQGERVTLEASLKPLPSEEQIKTYLDETNISLKKKPMICLFVIESLREDFVTEKNAPNIVKLRRENIQLGQTFSASNATPLSWHGIFHSTHPLYWSYAFKDQSQNGSLPLRLFKKLGYQIHVYSAAQLKYYQLSQMIFGKNHFLADSYHIFPHYFPIKAWQSDQNAIRAFTKELTESFTEEGHVCIFFLDSTHFNYSWPDGYPPCFTPFSEEGTNLRISNTESEIGLLQNRYRNAIHYVDSLVGKVLCELKAKNLYRDAVIVITGDHGEEFFEEGLLFHASHLSRVQTRVPIYYKLGKTQPKADHSLKAMLSSHIDIFPTIFDYLTKGELQNALWNGQSIFAKDRFPFVITARYNGGKPPSTFFIHNGEHKLTFKIKSTSQGSKKTVLEVLSIRDIHGKLAPSKGFSRKSHPFHPVYAPALETLFPASP